MFSSSPWETVRPSMWYPMSSLESSMMDFDHMAEEMLQSRYPLRQHHRMLAHPSGASFSSTMCDDDFFKDLPIKSAAESMTAEKKMEKEDVTSASNSSSSSPQDADATDDVHEKLKENEPAGKRAYSNYSYNSSSVVDDKGQRVESTRRRYEDSNGRLKAVLERKVGDKTLRTVWNKSDKDDKGTHEKICSNFRTEDDFEKLWKSTPFGQAAGKQAIEAQKKE